MTDEDFVVVDSAMRVFVEGDYVLVLVMVAVEEARPSRSGSEAVSRVDRDRVSKQAHEVSCLSEGVLRTGLL